MKNVLRALLLALMLLCLLVLLLPGMSFAATQVIDESGLFSADEIAQMDELISSIQDTYQMDAVVLTTDKVPNNRSSQSEEETMDYADEYFDRHGYGRGEDRAGLLYLIDMNNRVSYVSTNGVMIDYIDDDRLEELLNAADSVIEFILMVWRIKHEKQLSCGIRQLCGRSVYRVVFGYFWC